MLHKYGSCSVFWHNSNRAECNWSRLFRESMFAWHWLIQRARLSALGLISHFLSFQSGFAAVTTCFICPFLSDWRRILWGTSPFMSACSSLIVGENCPLDICPVIYSLYLNIRRHLLCKVQYQTDLFSQLAKNNNHPGCVVFVNWHL